ncbi:MAG: BMP family protein [Anaerolineae bacterium]
MRKSMLVTSLCLIATLLLAACAPAAPAPPPTEAPAEKMVFTMVTDQAGLGDQGFNDITWAGLQQAATDFNAEAKVVESTEQAQYVPNLTSLAQEDVNLIVGVGFLLVDAMQEVASANPDDMFALVDAAVEAPNVRGLLFREQEGSFLGGIIAGMTTQTNKVGVVGGMEIPPVIRWIAGFEAGVKTANPDAEVLVTYAGTFTDPAKGKEIALSQYDQGADVIFEVAGGTGIGAFQAASERGAGVWVFGTDRCKFDLAPDNALPDVTKRVDVAVYTTAQAVSKGTFSGGAVTLGLKEGGMGLCEETYQNISADIQAKVEAAREMIIDGTLTPPTTNEELATFAPPDLTK